MHDSLLIDVEGHIAFNNLHSTLAKESKPSWHNLQLTKPGLQYLELLDVYDSIFGKLWDANTERRGLAQNISGYIYLLNPTGLTFGEVYDEMIDIIRCLAQTYRIPGTISNEDREYSFQWKVHVLPKELQEVGCQDTSGSSKW